MADPFAQLQSMIDRVAALGPQTVRRAAPKVARALEAELVAQIGRGEGPDGKPWPLTKDGARALQGAAGALTVRAFGPVVVARLSGPEARHHKGAARGRIRRRRILPTSKLSPVMARVVARALLDQVRVELRGAL